MGLVIGRHDEILSRLLELSGVTQIFCYQARCRESVSVLWEAYEGVMLIGARELVEGVVGGEGNWLVPVDG